MHVKPVIVDCNFVVDATNGLGITSLKGPLVQNVFMHTSTTPAAGNSNPATPNKAITNPNPASGNIIVQLQDNYNLLYAFSHAVQSPNSGSDVKIDNSAMTAGVAYTITTLGNATAAKWHAIGVPAGVTPAVGVSFIAATNGGTGNVLTSKVQLASVSNVSSVELVGNPNMSIAPNIQSQGFGSQFIFQCLQQTVTMGAYTPAGTNSKPTFTVKNGTILANGTIGLSADSAGADVVGGTGITADRTLTTTSPVGTPTFTGAAASLTGTSALAIAAPAAGSLIRLTLYLSDSSVMTQGE